MASRWRIRQKLLVGLGVVICILVLLVAGTIYGMVSYHSTIRIFECKHAELKSAQDLSTLLLEINQCLADRDALPQDVRSRVEKAHRAFHQYKNQLEDTVRRGRDPDEGYQEKQLIDALTTAFQRVQKTLDDDNHFKMSFSPLPERRFVATEKEVSKLIRSASELEEAIYADMHRSSNEARKYYRNTSIYVVSCTLIGVMLMVGLMRVFYSWVFYPVRDLHAGATRVAQGIFDEPIQVQSNDELADLARAFNMMMSEVGTRHEDLTRQVHERSRQLIRSEQLASVGFLAAGVAHEINNPLASIVFCSEALEARVSSLLDSTPTQRSSQAAEREVIARYLKMVQEEALRCKKITQRLLEFSRGGENRRDPADLGDLVRSVLEVAKLLPNSKDKEIVFERAQPMVAWVNTPEIKQVILNLVVNALESMDEGGQLTIGLQFDGTWAHLTFRDTGCGMTEEVLTNIFEPFFTRSKTGKGTGLGLSISHRIIAQHGGEIEATSAGPGLGSTFTVNLPVRGTETLKEESLGRAAA